MHKPCTLGFLSHLPPHRKHSVVGQVMPAQMSLESVNITFHGNRDFASVINPVAVTFRCIQMNISIRGLQYSSSPHKLKKTYSV